MEKKLGNATVHVEKEDITLLDVDAFVYYAAHDLKLGTGMGGAIAVRGGPAIQKELDAIGKAETTQAVVTGAGELKAKQIIHAVGPRFQEPETEPKLAATMQAVLKLAEEKGLESLALPAMGCGFYGIPLDVSARIVLEEVKRHLAGASTLKQVRISVIDQREYKPFANRLSALA
jgi:O-acetyl-ADP-ribose deacetylase (regulator of RNase III)